MIRLALPDHRFSGAAEGAALRGLGSLGQADADGFPPGTTRESYTYVVNWNDAEIASDGTRAESFKIDTGYDFLVDNFMFSARLADALGASIAGTPLASESSPSGTNALPTLHQLYLEFTLTDRRWSSGPVCAAHLVSTAGRAFYQALRPLLPAGQTLTVNCINRSAVDIKADLSLIGQKVRVPKG